VVECLVPTLLGMYIMLAGAALLLNYIFALEDSVKLIRDDERLKTNVKWDCHVWVVSVFLKQSFRLVSCLTFINVAVVVNRCLADGQYNIDCSSVDDS